MGNSPRKAAAIKQLLAEEDCPPTPCSASESPKTDALEASIQHCMMDYTSRQYLLHSRQLERERNACVHALNDASILLAEIMRDEVNHQDEAEKWLRAYAPEYLFPQNAELSDREKSSQ